MKPPPNEARRARAGRALLAASLAALAACRGGAPSGAAAPVRADAEIAAILARAEREPLAYESLRGLLAVAPKRLSGSAGARRAVEWGLARMEELGFEEVRAEPVVVPAWVRGPVEEARVFVGSAPAGDGEELRVRALGGSPPTPPEGVEGEVVEVRSFEELAALGASARGKVVFFARPMDASDPDTFRAYGGAVDQRSRGGVEAKKAGAVAALVRSMTTRLDDAPHTGAMTALLEDGVTPAVPAAAVSTLGAERLHGLLASGRGPVCARLRLSCRFEEDQRSANVVGEIRGSERPGEVVLVGGHLDAWDAGDGAHDDGSGCAQAIEALRLLRACGLRPRRTIRAVLFMTEENGLAGGLAYDRAHAAESHLFAIESDRGGFAPRALAVAARGPAAEIRGLLPLLRPVGLEEVREGGPGADISPLDRRGVPCGQLVPDASRYFDYHHCEHDVLEAVDPADLERGAAVLAAVLWRVANS